MRANSIHNLSIIDSNTVDNEDIYGAIKAAQEALCIHSGTGRLWAVLIQLKQSKGIASQLKVFQRALREVPKSGEVWCEGARIALSNNETGEARRFLDFAIQFTPQYGDSFIEYMRLELMENGFGADTSKLEQACVNADPNYGTMWLHSKKHPLDSTRQVLRNAKLMLIETSSKECGDSEDSTVIDDENKERSQRLYYGNNECQDSQEEVDTTGDTTEDAADAEECEDLGDSEDFEEQFRQAQEKTKHKKDHMSMNCLQGEEDSLEEHEDNISSFDEDAAEAINLAIAHLAPKANKHLHEHSPIVSSASGSTPSSISSSPLLSPSPSPSPPTTRGAMMVGGYGVLSLNRVYRDSSELPSTERKKLIFGSDQIKP